jgi:hypothetical protein
LEKLVSTLFFIKCNKITIQLTVFYKRGEFYWIGNDGTKKSRPKWFGDVPRGMNLYVYYISTIKKKSTKNKPF